MAHIDRLTDAYNHLEIATQAILQTVTAPGDRQRVAKALRRLEEWGPFEYSAKVLHGSDHPAFNDPQHDDEVDGVVECPGIRYEPGTGECVMMRMLTLDAVNMIDYVSRKELSEMLGVK